MLIRAPNGRCTADKVAVSSRQYDEPWIPHIITASVTAGGTARVHSGPAANSSRWPAGGSIAGPAGLHSRELPPVAVTATAWSRQRYEPAAAPGDGNRAGSCAGKIGRAHV